MTYINRYTRGNLTYIYIYVYINDPTVEHSQQLQVVIIILHLSYIHAVSLKTIEIQTMHQATAHRLPTLEET